MTQMPSTHITSRRRREKVRAANAHRTLAAVRTPLADVIGSLRLLATMLVLAAAIAAGECALYSAAAGWFGFADAASPFSYDGFCLFPFVVVPLLIGMLFGPAQTVAVGFLAMAALWAATRFNPCTNVCALFATLVMARRAPHVRDTHDLAALLVHQLVLQTLACLAVLAVQRYFVLEEGSAIDGRYLVAQFAGLFLLTALSIPVTLGLFLPLAERLTGRISAYSLVAFANLENPLLQRLSREAPGTYGHSMVVADLASSAAEAVGADGLLARLGGYYHDIGKLSNPSFFMENQSALTNPHDALPPSISLMIIGSHVKDGLILARDEGLPAPITRMIERHHGTSSMQWFKLKADAAARAAGEAGSENDAFYRYGGPLPETAEETIVSLADSVEAASRSLSSNAPGDIARLVGRVVDGKLADGQLARSALSVIDLETVKRSLSLTLLHRLHGRKAYPPATTTPPAPAPQPVEPAAAPPAAPQPVEAAADSADAQKTACENASNMA